MNRVECAFALVFWPCARHVPLSVQSTRRNSEPRCGQRFQARQGPVKMCRTGRRQSVLCSKGWIEQATCGEERKRCNTNSCPYFYRWIGHRRSMELVQGLGCSELLCWLFKPSGVVRVAKHSNNYSRYVTEIAPNAGHLG